MLKATGIDKSYGTLKVLSGVELSVKPGSCVGIVGGNGCGKTTLLSILCGAGKADRGSILVGGQETVGHPKVAARGVAYVPQENPLMEELTVRDNLTLWYRGNKLELEQDLRQGASAMLGIPQMLNRTVGKLSGGMKKRVSIACALSNHAPLLIMDEPGAALDLECKEAIRSYLKEFIKVGNSVLFTSHEMAELSLCTEMYVLKEGMLCPIKTGLSEKEMIALF